MDLIHQVACIRREIALRRNVYPKWVATGRMTKEVADQEMTAMQAVLVTLTITLPKALDHIAKLEAQIAQERRPTDDSET